MSLKSIRNALVSGMLMLAPVAVTLFVIDFLIQKVGVPTRRMVFFFIPPDPLNRIWMEYGLYLASTVVVLVLITLLGWLSKKVIGRLALHAFERAVDAVPVIRSVYNTVKQIRDTFVHQEKPVFQQSVLVEYPRKGVYVLGFLTGSSRGEIQDVTHAHLLNIFIPTTPNPTSGFLLMVPEDEVIRLKLSVTDGMKLIISGGAVVPDFRLPLPKPGGTPQP